MKVRNNANIEKMDDKTINTYNLLATDYDNETIDFWERFPPTIINEFVSNTKKLGRVLNVGSGPGRDGLILQKNGLDVTCLDASEAMVKMCKERGLISLVGDFNKMPFENEVFDGVWAYTSLLHVPKEKIDISMSEIVRVLKKGGVLGLGLIEGDFNDYRESSGVGMPRWFSFYTKEEVEKLLQKFGFEIVHFEQFKPASKNYLNFIARLK
ncbi:MAG: methyltransferase domain-containing protein [bacterium]